MQQDEALGNGTCSTIISVQEIVRSDAENVPERYIRNPDDRPKSSEISLVPADRLPVIDFSVCSRRRRRKKKVRRCLQGMEFFPEETLPKVKAAAAQFFDLPLLEKKKYGGRVCNRNAEGDL
ncbi:UNVERIFIED_CONTAM: hypothetical protein Scaly_3074000 [Sesamum calycinum]|uniref:Uncharacterized protein n=1 Tax=Sesamum calycinum TaxID=2727403 RepID=A0AAW2JVV6_9LAMI